ncbi:MAG: hypothetical protein K1W24_14325 [Lachnospiraceae bacterium]
MKLMQGIEETENQMKKEKTTQKPEKKENVENEAGSIQKTVGKLKTAKKQPRAKKNTGIGKKDGNAPDKMQKKQVFSFRAVLADISIWKTYAVASGKTMEDICNAAMNEYLKKHKLAGAEQAIFEAIKARDQMTSNRQGKECNLLMLVKIMENL